METEQSQKKPCPRCGKVRTEGGGSITQWISACNCSDSETKDESLPPATICQTCGKRQEQGRSGSFTQWVFRQDLCSCNQPGFVGRGGSSTNSGAYTVERDAVDEEELPVNPDKFPLARYKPLAELGRGAAGTVYLCRDRLLGTKVAVKVLNVLTSEKLVSFQNEAKATSRLNHKNIVKILDFGATESGYPYMTMERFQGESLESYMADHGTLPIPMAISIISEVAEGLEYAHEKGVFHRDIKPSNLLLSFDDAGQSQVMIIDFGVAQLEARSQEPTIFQGKTMVGSPKYMSPDQANGLPYDERSEVYSVGCVLFESLTGQPPFDGETPLEIIGRHANELPPRIRELPDHGHTPIVLDEIIAKTLAKNPNERHQNMTDLKTELSRAVQQETRTVIGPYSPAATGKPKPYLVITSLAILTLILATVASTLLPQNQTKTTKLPKTKKVNSTRHKGPTKGHMDIGSFEPNYLHWNIDEGVWTSDTSIKDSDLRLLKGKEVRKVLVRDTIITNEGIRQLSEFQLPIDLLDLTNTKVDDGAAPFLVKFPELRALYLSRTKIGDGGIEKLRGLPKLNRLELDDCPITDRAVEVITTRWPMIENLDISSSKVTTRSFEMISKLKNIHHLMVANQKLNNRDMDLITSLPLVTADFTESDLGNIENVKKLARLKKTLQTVELSLVKPKIDAQTAKWLQKEMSATSIRPQSELENDMDVSRDMQPPIEFLGE